MVVNRDSVKYNINCILTRSKHPSIAFALSHLIFSATSEVNVIIIFILEMK